MREFSNPRTVVGLNSSHFNQEINTSELDFDLKAKMRPTIAKFDYKIRPLPLINEVYDVSVTNLDVVSEFHG